MKNNERRHRKGKFDLSFFFSFFFFSFLFCFLFLSFSSFFFFHFLSLNAVVWHCLILFHWSYTWLFVFRSCHMITQNPHEVTARSRQPAGKFVRKEHRYLRGFARRWTNADDWTLKVLQLTDCRGLFGRAEGIERSGAFPQDLIPRSLLSGLDGDTWWRLYWS